jgi:hypothetical protein
MRLLIESKWGQKYQPIDQFRKRDDVLQFIKMATVNAYIEDLHTKVQEWYVIFAFPSLPFPSLPFLSLPFPSFQDGSLLERYWNDTGIDINA